MMKTLIATTPATTIVALALTSAIPILSSCSTTPPVSRVHDISSEDDPQKRMEEWLGYHYFTVEWMRWSADYSDLEEAAGEAHSARQGLLSTLTQVSYQKSVSPEESAAWYDRLKATALMENEAYMEAVYRLEREE
jgi:hypothetical protein